MAKYNVTYSCGHTQETVLFGKGDERRRKIAFFEKEGLCKECYKKHIQEVEKAEKEAEVKKKIAKPTFSRLGGKDVEFKIIFSDGAEPLIYVCNNMDAFTTKTAEILAQVKKMGYKYDGSAITTSPTYEKLLEINELWKKTDEEVAAIDQAEKEKQAAKPKAECFDFMKEKHGADYEKWNRTIYGRKGGYNYYIKGIKYSMTDEQRDAIETYRAAAKEWKEKYN